MIMLNGNLYKEFDRLKKMLTVSAILKESQAVENTRFAHAESISWDSHDKWNQDFFGWCLA